MFEASSFTITIAVDRTERTIHPVSEA
jgi:hypothetical protein